MINNSALSASSNSLVIDENTMVKSSELSVDNAVDNAGYKEVKPKRKASGEHSIADKRSRVQEIAVYIKGTKCNLTKRNPKLIQQSILKEFGHGFKAQLAGESIRLICPSELTKTFVLARTHLGDDPIVVTRPRYETSETKRKNKAVIYGVEEDIDLEELVFDNKHNGLVTAQRLFARAEGLKYTTKTVVLEFDREYVIPDVVSYGWRDYSVKEYIPTPIRCFKCQGFSHLAKDCKRTIPCCPRCAGAHYYSDCNAYNSEIKCKGCGLGHSAAYKGCPRYAWVQENLKQAVRTNRPYSELFKANKDDLKIRIEVAKFKSEQNVHNVHTAAAFTAPVGSTPADVPTCSTPLRSVPLKTASIGPPLSPVKTALTAPVQSIGGPLRPHTATPGTSTHVQAAYTGNRPSSTPARRLHGDKQTVTPVPTGQVVMTVQKLIALVINLLHSAGGQISADRVQSCIDSALQFLGVGIQFQKLN